MLLSLLLAVMVMMPKPPAPKSENCFSCDAGVHHPGQAVSGCKCSCGSSG